MNSEIRITNSKTGPTVIDIEGTIGVPEEWQFDEPAGRVATYDKFQRTITAIGRIKAAEVVVNIRSTGGDVGDALLIHDALAGLEKATITTRCHGYVASSATIIAQAASQGRREISANALYLVHNSVAACEGNVGALNQSMELLAKTDERIASIYAARSGMGVENFTALMAENNGSGRWLSPQETVDAGLADRIFVAEKGAGAGAGKSGAPKNSAHAEALRVQQDVELEKLRHRLSALESDNRQAQARPTETKPKEDPSPATESRLSANENAYRRDMENFFK